MPPRKQWEEEDEDSSSPSSPPAGPVRRGKFDDEEGDDSDVLESWDAADDSEAEREKAKKAADAKAKADADAAAAKKSKSQRIAEHQADRARRRAEDPDAESSDDETPSEMRERLRKTEREADLHVAEDLFGGLSVGGGARGTKAPGTVVALDPADPSKVVDLADIPVFKAKTKTQAQQLREVVSALLAGGVSSAQQVLFFQDLTKDLAKSFQLSSDQLKKAASGLTALSNEKLKEEKAADRSGKKTKAQKTKTTLVTNRQNAGDTNTYEESFNDDDFM